MDSPSREQSENHNTPPSAKACREEGELSSGEEEEDIPAPSKEGVSEADNPAVGGTPVDEDVVGDTPEAVVEGTPVDEAVLGATPIDEAVFGATPVDKAVIDAQVENAEKSFAPRVSEEDKASVVDTPVTAFVGDTNAEKPDKQISPSADANPVDLLAQSSVNSDIRKPVEKRRIPFISTKTNFTEPSTAHNSLVIRFSDNESDSDSEGKQQKSAEIKDVVSHVDENRRPTPSSYLKTGFPQKTYANKPRFQLQQGSLSRTYFASNGKYNGSEPKSARKPVIKPHTFIRNHYASEQKQAHQFHRSNKGSDMVDGELQDLRQKIALRETEMKLNMSRKIRETTLNRNHNSSTANISTEKRGRASSSAYLQPGAMEPDRKRLKDDSSGQIKQVTTVGMPELGGKFGALPFKNTSGPDLNPTGSQSNIISQPRNQLVVLNQTTEVHGASIGQEPESVKNMVGLGCMSNIECSGPDDHSLESLFAMEEMQDAELEKAQEYRRNCEIEERNALKAYRRAQCALVEAIATCNSLYRQREPSSAQYMSSLIGVPNLEVYSRFMASRINHTDMITGGNTDGDGCLRLLLEMEDLQEKELEEAQEQRHKCEVDERNFLKAYRRSQCKLIDASDRCSNLYQQRQVLVTRANGQLYSRCFNQFPINETNHCNIKTGGDLEVIPSSHCTMLAQVNVNKVDDGSNFCGASNGPPTISDQYVHGNNMGSDVCSDPDGGSSAPLPHPESNANAFIGSSHRSPVTSADNSDQPPPSYNRSFQIESGCQRQCSSSEGKENDNDDGLRRSFPVDCEQDSLLREADLRSALYARLRQKPFAENRGLDVQKVQHTVERDSESDFENMTSKMCTRDSCIRVEKSQLPIFGVEREEDGDALLSMRSAASSPDSVLWSAFARIKDMSLSSIDSKVLLAKVPQNHSQTKCNVEDSENSSESIRLSGLMDNPLLSVKDIFAKQYESYSCSIDADPFWPFCMYELRGRCNDEQCSWQHIKVHSSKSMNWHGAFLKAGCGTRQQFNISLGISRLLKRKVSTVVPSGHARHRWFQASESDRQLSYLQNQDLLLNDSMHDTESLLETALLVLEQEVNRFESTNKALVLLARAIEADPKSSAVWIVYLLIYYSIRRSKEKDDMFSYAVENNAGSYELWLLYINSRVDLNDRLVAYDKALCALSDQRPVSHCDVIQYSSCILDLSLQMLDCLCMCGQAEKAMGKLDELVHIASSSYEATCLLSNVYYSLTVSDRCILWVCCVYLRIYRRLPDAMVNRFELQKEHIEIEWPLVELKDDAMQRSLELVKTVEHIVDSYVHVGSPVCLTTLKSLQFFAINHFRCIVALEGFSSGKKVAERYIRLYPSCLELVLLLVRMCSNDFKDLTITGFEEALLKWPREVLGIHCIWNQYAAHALESQRHDIASEILCRWYESTWKEQDVLSEISKNMDSDDLDQHSPIACPNSSDEMFGWLTLALYHKLQSGDDEAQSAVDRALKIAPPDMYKHCVKEHATFYLMGVQVKDETSVSGSVSLFKSYLDDPRASSTSCALSRKFIQDIRKPKVQQLVSNLLAETSADYSILNSALEAWCGPSLIPQDCSEVKQVVNFVEAIMEIAPTNYVFATSVFRLVSRDYNSKDVARTSLLFWAGSLLVNSIIEAVPAPPESVWVEASSLLNCSSSVREISQRFHDKAVCVYPFSVRLWKSYINMSKTESDAIVITELTKERGLQIEILEAGF